MNVKPKDDHQFDHHLETLTTSLIHDGRFREARADQGRGDRLQIPPPGRVKQGTNVLRCT